MHKIAVIGAGTLLGRELVDTLEPKDCSVLPLSHAPTTVEEELSDLLMAQVDIHIKKRVKRMGRMEEMGEVVIQFGSLDALNGLIERLAPGASR